MIKSILSPCLSLLNRNEDFFFLGLLKVFLNLYANGKGPFITEPLIHKWILKIIKGLRTTKFKATFYFITAMYRKKKN